MKVGILGAGGMGNVHAAQYRKMPGVEIFFFDRKEERLQKLIEKYQADGWTELARVIENVDVIDICLPTDLHAEIGLQAIAAGKPIFVEKPIARTLDEAISLVEAAEEAKVALMPGQVVRYFPEFRKAHDLVLSGQVGRPAAARTRRGGPAPKGSSDWFMDHERSGGVLLDLAIHDFDWLRWTFGEVDHLYSRSVGLQAGSGPDYALTTLTFDSGVVAHVEATWMDPSGFRTTLEVAGSEGLIQFDSKDQPAVRVSTPDGSRGDTPRAPLDDPYYLEIRGFLDAVRDGTPPPVSGWDGVNALAISLAAIESAKTGKVVVPQRFPK
jgi:predicted dehydrogenase